MSNRILIKHGNAEPTETQLAPYELGYSSEEETIYFNNNGAINEQIIPVSAGYAIKKVNELPSASNAKDRIIYMVPSIGDNNGATYNVASEEPSDTSKLWIDTSSDYPLLKFYDTSSNSWKDIAAVWS